jgi:hypothetical protein
VNGRTFLWRGVPKKKNEVIPERGENAGFAAEGGLTATGDLVAPPAPTKQTLTGSKQI